MGRIGPIGPLGRIGPICLIGLICPTLSCSTAPQKTEPQPNLTRTPPELLSKQVITIDGPVEDQAAINSWLAKLEDACKGGRAPSPFGQTDRYYKGHIFWDADMWVFPALCLLNPERAYSVPLERMDFVVDLMGAIPWETAGWDSQSRGLYLFPATPPEAERHRSAFGSSAWMVRRALALGMVPSARPPGKNGDQADARTLLGLAGKHYGDLAKRTPRGYEIKAVKSIDEFAEEVDNDLYTNLVAQEATGLPFYLPRDKTTFLTYEGDAMRTYQQAAAVLAIFPLQHPQAEKEARLMMERFESKVNKAGPAMSDSIHATIWARLGETERSYKTWQQSFQDFQTIGGKLDLNVFREYRNRDRTYFVTGAAGCLNTVLYGFCGFRIDSKPLPGATWKKQLHGGYWLSVKPNLPKAWRRIRVPFTVFDTNYILEATHDGAAVTQGES